MSEEICILCNRPLAEPCNKHHVLPRSQGGKGTLTVLIHKICHDKIHSVLSEKELARKYSTMDILKNHPEIKKFIEWVRKKPPEFYDHSAKAKK